MIVGVCTIELRLRETRSLKDKRQVLKSIITRVKNNFNVAIAEVDYQDKWQRALLCGRGEHRTGPRQWYSEQSRQFR
jgi:uncharacterized protein YlxP (DUF503 family)